MSIVILTQTFPLNPKDSTAHFMFDFARGFTELGHQVTILLPFHPKLRVKSFKNIKIFYFKYIWPDFLHLLGFGRTLENDQRLKWFVYFLAPLYLLFATIKLYSTISKYKIEIINTHWILPNGFIAAIVSKLTNTPLFITLPGSDVYLAKQNFLFKWAAKFALSQTKKVISNSPQLLKDLGISGEIISYPVPKNHTPRTIHQELTIATAGRDVEKKGFEILKKIYPEIEIISELSIDQFRKKLLSVDIFIAYSIRDSKGNLDDASLTILEAMAAGCAVITTNLPGNCRIIQHKQNGWLIDPKKPRSLFSAINSLKKDALLRQQLGTAAKLTIKKRFTPEKIAQAYLALFEATTK